MIHDLPSKHNLILDSQQSDTTMRVFKIFVFVYSKSSSKLVGTFGRS